MSEKDRKDKKEKELTRRHFCQTAGASACFVAGTGGAVLTVDFLRPQVLFEPPTDFSVSAADALAVGQVLSDEDHQVYVVRSEQGYRAMSSVCTHLGCITRYQQEEGVITCPCHGSRFSLEGEVLAGPAPRPLIWLQMDRSAGGEITVDRGLVVPWGTTFKL